MSLLIFSPYFAPHVGGVEAYLAEFLAACTPARAGTSITVATTKLPPTAAAVDSSPEGATIVRMPAFDAIPNFPVPALWSPALWRALRRATTPAPSVVVSHTRFFLTSVMAWAVARRFGARWIHIEHGSDYVQLDARFPSLVARAYDRTVGRLVLRHTDACIAISRAAADFVLRLAGRTPQLLYRGVERTRLERIPASEDVRRLAAGRTTIAYVGRLIDGKGVGDLLDALATLEDRDFLCCLVGDGPRRQQLEARAARLGLGERVVFMGYVGEDDVIATLKAADVVVNPSYTEGLPSSVLYAALCGRAVVATDVGGTPEIVKDGTSGLLVAPRDVAALSNSLARAIADPELRARLGEAAFASASHRFAWEPAVDRFLELAGLSRAPDRVHRAPATPGTARGSEDARRPS